MDKVLTVLMKKGNKKIEKVISEILDLVMRINTETDLCAFFNLSGHVGIVDVNVAVSKDMYKTKVFDAAFVSYVPYYEDGMNEEEFSVEIDGIIGTLNGIKTTLKAFLSKKEKSFVRVSPLDAMEGSTLFVVDDNGNFSEIVIDAMSESCVYSSEGKRYGKVYALV